MSTYCFLNTQHGNEVLDQIVVELFVDKTPKTCENFRQLCIRTEKAEGENLLLSYKGSTFHRVIKDFMLQAGDFTNHNGTGGVSIYGEQFDDENFDIPCDRPGLLCMANRGPNTNGSQFFITTAASHHLTGKHVVFGKVVRGMNAVRYIESVDKGANDKPAVDVKVIDCGELTELPAKALPADGDEHPDYPQDCDPALSDADALVAAEAIRQVGNGFFTKGELAKAIAKYGKALRYLSTAVPTSATGPQIDDKMLACHSNTAMCHLKLAQWRAAKTAATMALRIDNKNVKALFRRAQASAELNDFDDATKDLEVALKVDPSNADVPIKLAQIKEKENANKQKLKAGYAKMFA